MAFEAFRDFVSLLNLLVQYPDKKIEDIAGDLTPALTHKDPTAITPEDAQDDNDPLNRFTNFNAN